jgi:hypothetical protein
MRRRVALFGLVSVLTTGLLALVAPTPGKAADSSEQPRVRIELVSEVEGVRPGTPFWVALRQTISPGWHTYWKNPGDSGEPTTLDWTLPSGTSAGEIAWPPPERIRVGPARLRVRAGLLCRITPPATFPDLPRVAAAWLVCESASRRRPPGCRDRGLPPADPAGAGRRGASHSQPRPAVRPSIYDLHPHRCHRSPFTASLRRGSIPRMGPHGYAAGGPRFLPRG